MSTVIIFTGTGSGLYKTNPLQSRDIVLAGDLHLTLLYLPFLVKIGFYTPPGGTPRKALISSAKHFSRGTSWVGGSCNTVLVNPIISRLGGEVEKSQPEIPCMVGFSSKLEGRILCSPEPQPHFPGSSLIICTFTIWTEEARCDWFCWHHAVVWLIQLRSDKAKVHRCIRITEVSSVVG